MLNSKEGQGLFLSVVIVVGQPLCPESVNIQGKEDNESVCVCMTNKRRTAERALVSSLLSASLPL